jgi:hypothetical protein
MVKAGLFSLFASWLLGSAKVLKTLYPLTPTLRYQSVNISITHIKIAKGTPLTSAHRVPAMWPRHAPKPAPIRKPL